MNYGLILPLYKSSKHLFFLKLQITDLLNKIIWKGDILMICSVCGKDLTRLLSLSQDIATCPYCGQAVPGREHLITDDIQKLNRDVFDNEEVKLMENTIEVPFDAKDFDAFEMTDVLQSAEAVNKISEIMETFEGKNDFDEDDDDDDDEIIPEKIEKVFIEKSEIKTPAHAIRYLMDKDGTYLLKKTNQKRFYDKLCKLLPKKDLKAIKTAIDKGAVDIIYSAIQKNADKQEYLKRAKTLLTSKTFVSADMATEAIKAFEFGLRWDKETLELETKIKLRNVLNFQTNTDTKINELQKQVNEGNVNAMKELADYYFENGMSYKEQCLAFDNYTKAYKKGDIEALYKLGLCYRRGKGTKQNLKEAYNCFIKAASNKNIEAIKNLYEFYEKGLFVQKNINDAVYWLSKAAELGDVESQCRLGKCFIDGYGTEKSNEKAAYWFARAAEQSNAEGQLNLAHCYKNGIGVPVDNKRALAYYTLAANQGNAVAQYILGNYYYMGKGVKQEYETAAKWFTQAAKQGLPVAEYVLGRCYETGIGVNRSFTYALKWYTNAAENGYDKAKTDCERVDLKRKGQYFIKRDFKH